LAVSHGSTRLRRSTDSTSSDAALASSRFTHSAVVLEPVELNDRT
jgi:hypothetical protein